MYFCVKVEAPVTNGVVAININRKTNIATILRI